MTTIVSCTLLLKYFLYKPSISLSDTFPLINIDALLVEANFLPLITWVILGCFSENTDKNNLYFISSIIVLGSLTRILPIKGSDFEPLMMFSASLTFDEAFAAILVVDEDGRIDSTGMNAVDVDGDEQVDVDVDVEGVEDVVFDKSLRLLRGDLNFALNLSLSPSRDSINFKFSGLSSFSVSLNFFLGGS